MRLVYTLAALCLIAATARAEQPQFFLKPDGTVEQRVAKVESDVSRLEARIVELEKQLGNVAAKSKASTAATSTPAKVRYSVCVNGRCTIYEVDEGTPIPAGATILSGNSSGFVQSTSMSTSGSPCPTGGCGDACGCVAPVASTRRSGWYPGPARTGRGLRVLRVFSCDPCAGISGNRAGRT